MGYSVKHFHEMPGFTNRAELLNAYHDVCLGDSMKHGGADRFGESLWGFARSKFDIFANITEQYRNFLGDGKYCPDGLTSHNRKFLVNVFHSFGNELQKNASLYNQEELFTFSQEVEKIITALGNGRASLDWKAYFQKGLELKGLKSIFQAWKSIDNPFRGNLTAIDGILEEISSKVPPKTSHAYRFLYYTVIYLIQHFEDPSPPVVAHFFIQFMESLEHDLRMAKDYLVAHPEEITIKILRLAADLIDRYSNVANKNGDRGNSNGTPFSNPSSSMPPAKSSSSVGSAASVLAVDDVVDFTVTHLAGLASYLFGENNTSQTLTAHSSIIDFEVVNDRAGQNVSLSKNSPERRAIQVAAARNTMSGAYRVYQSSTARNIINAIPLSHALSARQLVRPYK